MKKSKKFLVLILTLIMLLAVGVVGVLGGCSSNDVYVSSIVKSGTNGLVDTYTITYSDGKTSTFEITNGESVDLEDLYAKYLTNNPDALYADFLREVINVNNEGNSLSINKALKSSAKVYTEFTEKYRISPFQTTTETAIYLGSAVVYKIESDSVYFITNYHVVYNASATEVDKIAKKIVVYIYGSEGSPVSTNAYLNGCTVYDYGCYGIECEYVGGSVTADIAIVKANLADVKAINEDVEAITFAEGYHVGETAIAIGNPEGEGLSVTEGIISVDNENINLSIDGTVRSYRSIRIDTAIYSGSSGGGLFNTEGKLIGITNAGAGDAQNVNYAIPVEIVRSAVENIMFYANNGEKNAKTITLGITVRSENSKYVYDQGSGYGKIDENVYVDSIIANSIAQKVGLKVDDRIVSITINGVKQYINRYFEIGDILLKIRSGDVINIAYERNGSIVNGSNYTVVDTDLSIIA